MAHFLLLLRQEDGQVHFFAFTYKGRYVAPSNVRPFVGWSNLSSIHQAIFNFVIIKFVSLISISGAKAYAWALVI